MASFSRAFRVVGLQLEHFEIERNRFLDLLRGREIIGHLFEHGRVVPGMRDGFLKKSFTRLISSGFGSASVLKTMEA